MPRPRKINPKALYFSPLQTDVMDLIEAYPVTAFSAPVGFGKTTFLREYARKSRKSVMMHTVHSGETKELWQELCGRLSEKYPSFTEEVFGTDLPRSSEEQMDFFARVRKLLPADFELVLILDRFERVREPAVRDFILLTAQEFFGRIRFALAGRTVIWDSRSLPVIRGIVAPFFINFFVQTPDDIRGYFKKCGIDIPRDRADQLYASTGGWFSLLQIHVFRYLEIGIPGVSGNLAGIIEAAVRESVRPEVSGLMSLVATDEEFTREELEFLAGRALSESEFNELTLSNSFIYYNYETGRYHIHRVLRNYYADLLELLPEEDRIARYSRLSSWYREKSPLFLAMKYAFLAREYDQLMELTILSGRKGNSYESMAALRRYFTSCPKEILLRYPEAILYYLDRFYRYGERGHAKDALSILDRSLEGKNCPPEEQCALLSRREECLALGAFNDIDAMIAHYKEAGRYAARTGLVPRIDLPSAMGNTVLFPLFYKGGSMEKTCRQIRELEETGLAIGDTSFMGLAHLAEGEAAYFSCEYGKAKILAERALLECRGQQNWSTEICALHLKVKVCISEGSIADAREYLVRMRSIVNDYCERDTQLARVVDLCECFFNIKMNREWETAPWLREGRFFSEEILPSAIPNVYCTYQGLLLALGQYATVISIDDVLQTTAEQFGNRIYQIYGLIHTAAAYDALGFPEDAAARMKKAMDLALPYKIYAPFAENSKATARILERIRLTDPQILTGLENVIEAYDHSLRRGNTVYNGPSVVDLTRREIKISYLAAAGSTNEEIAEELHLSVNTIKAALKVIFRKLSISSRRDLPEKLRSIRIDDSE